jgi:hypothetical protein
MKKLVAATLLAAAALAAQSAIACDWNREASAAQQQVATTTPVQQPQTATTAPQTANATLESSKPIEPTAPMVLVNDRH